MLVLALAGCTRPLPGHPLAAKGWHALTGSHPSHPAPKVTRGPAEGSGGTPVVAGGRTPRPAHVVVVVFENKKASSVVGSSHAPYLTGLAHRGAYLTQSYGVAHPSQPNYLALFSGSTQGVTGDRCPQRFHTGNLGAQLRTSGDSYASYAEGLPSTGYPGCRTGHYDRAIAPWTDFASVPAGTQRPLTAFPHDYAKLPTVSFVLPNMCHNMHYCSVATGDRWARRTLDPYARWAQTHHSVLLVTFDEDDDTTVNRVPTILVGQPVRPGTYPEHVDHYTILRTLEAMYGLPPLGTAADRQPLTNVFQQPPITRRAAGG
ncbi:acid phosphatase [Actinocatenispora thailandica]|uniref:Acid phosphatase n=1 Tax=Actinocatenispora thailandica TaxID=227318 RepID=A0A7R7DRV4_9ACTN|nr:acid phosphatase [Actinocatenispora thailandica]